MTGKRKTIIVVLIVAVACLVRYSCNILTRPAVQPKSQETGPVAKVRVITLNRGTIEKTLVVYGTVVSAIGKTQTLSVPFECQVREVLVTAGQLVDANTPLIEIAPSPDTRLQLEQALARKETAKSNLEIIKQRIGLKLATRQDIVSAQQELESAELNYKSMLQRGIDGNKTILAGSRGIVSRIDVEQGQIVSAGSALVETIGQNQISVRLGVENEDIRFLKPEQPVLLYQVNAREKKEIDGHIKLITHRVNPETRMVDIFVVPENGANLLLNDFVETQIVVVSNESFVVPRSAVLPEEAKYLLYTIEDDHAKKHIVNIGLTNSDKVQVSGDNLEQGQEVVVTGNYELTDGMAVQVEREK
jgi:membrane fusion protein (multidrug efflux system)